MKTIKITEDEPGTHVFEEDVDGALHMLGFSKMKGHGGRVAALRNASARLRRMSERLGAMAERESARKAR